MVVQILSRRSHRSRVRQFRSSWLYVPVAVGGLVAAAAVAIHPF